MFKKLLPVFVIMVSLMPVAPAEASTLKEKAKTVTHVLLMPFRVMTTAAAIMMAESAVATNSVANLLDLKADTKLDMTFDFVEAE